MSKPILYSFRRCPYAMRARMALKISEIDFEHRDILLKNKPAEMLEASPKGTVPVLLLPDGTVLEESLDIMRWVLTQNDPENWLEIDEKATEKLIIQNDGVFKYNLDRYKYPSRYPDEDCTQAATICYEILEKLDIQLENKCFLFGQNRTFADIAIFPFVRQFSFVDKNKFNSKNMPNIQVWRKRLLESELFQDVMKKREIWTS